MTTETAERVYGNKKIVEMVTAASTELSSKVCDPTSFEQACYTRIMSSIEKLGDIENLEGLAYNIIRLVRRDFYKNRQSERLLNTTFYEGFTKDEKDRTFEIEDENFVPAIDRIIEAEENIELKQKISVLANGDRKKELILTAWANGLTNDLELSRLLAQSLGGKAEAHRKYIARFRAKCQQTW